MKGVVVSKGADKERVGQCFTMVACVIAQFIVCVSKHQQLHTGGPWAAAVVCQIARHVAP